MTSSRGARHKHHVHKKGPAAIDPFFTVAREADWDYDPTPLSRVYFLLDHEAAQIKIGITTNLDARVEQLRRERGRPLELLGSLRGNYDLERAMHGRFAAHRVERREWYSTEIAADVFALLAEEV